MKIQLNIDNYEEIMFRLLEDDFDEPTRTDLLEQIAADELFKFEWESWQRTKFHDALENYEDESRELTDKILLIAEPKPAKRKLIFYFLAAASIILILGTIFLLNVDHKSGSKQAEISKETNHQTSEKQTVTEVKIEKAKQIPIQRKQFQKPNRTNKPSPIVTDSIFIIPDSTMLAEIPPVIDSVPVKTIELAKVPDKKPRYTITIETTDIIADNQNNNDLAQNQKVKIKKVFTNTKFFLSRKPNGEPDRIILVGDDNSYICLNLNY
jgi:hypothetical protein